MSESWPIAEARTDVRRRLMEVLDNYDLPVSRELLRDLVAASNELWTAEQVAEHTGQKATSVPPWIARHGVPRFTGAVYSRTAVEQAKAAMPGRVRGARLRA